MVAAGRVTVLLCVTACSVAAFSGNNGTTCLDAFFISNITSCMKKVDAERILRGPKYQMGDYQNCVYSREDKYCVAEVYIKPTGETSQFWDNIEKLNKIPTHFRRDLLYVGLCVPKQLQVPKITRELQESLQEGANSLGVSTAVAFQRSSCQTKESFPAGTLHYLFLFVVLGIIFLVVSATVYDVVRRSNGSNLLEETQGEKLLLCFSLLINWQKFVAERHSDLDAMDGIRVLATLGCLASHVLLIIMNSPLHNPEWIEESYNDLIYTSIYSFSLVMGTFLSLSGFLLAVTLLKEFETKGVISTKTFIMAVVHRYFRLTPLYAVAIAFKISWLGNIWDMPGRFHFVERDIQNCRHNWWINLLYFNNYFRVEDICMQNSWYVAAEFQCFIVTTLVLTWVLKYQQYAKQIMSSLLLMIVAATFTQTYVEQLDPFFLLLPEPSRDIGNCRTYQRSYITVPYNIGSYLIGAIFGWIYCSLKCNVGRSKEREHLIIWPVILVTTVAMFVITYNFYQPSYVRDAVIASLFASTYKMIFATIAGAAITCFALGCDGQCNTFLSWRLFQILGRLSYVVYLFQVQFLEVLFTARYEPLTLSGTYFWYTMVLVTVMLYLLAVPLHLFIELPFSSLPKLIFVTGRAKDQQLKKQH